MVKSKKVITVIFSAMVIVCAGLELFADIHIPGLLPLAMAVIMIFQAASGWNDYRNTKQKVHIVLMVICVMAAIMSFLAGIVQVFPPANLTM